MFNLSSFVCVHEKNACMCRASDYDQMRLNSIFSRHVRPVNFPVYFLKHFFWWGAIKESGIWNHRWQANMCERGREWGMALEVANVWRGRSLKLFLEGKEKLSLSVNNGETNYPWWVVYQSQILTQSLSLKTQVWRKGAENGVLWRMAAQIWLFKVPDKFHELQILQSIPATCGKPQHIGQTQC